MRLKIFPLRPNSTQEVGRNTIVFLLKLLSCSILFVRALQQNSKRLIMRVTTNLLIWRRLRKTIASVNKIYAIVTTN